MKKAKIQYGESVVGQMIELADKIDEFYKDHIIMNEYLLGKDSSRPTATEAQALLHERQNR